MNALTDVLLNPPLGDFWARWMLFFFFYLHLFFILILIGTAIIGVHHFLHSYWTKENFEHRWDKKVLHKFIIPKALGVVIGVLALLVIQLYYAVPFFTSTSLFAPFWLTIIIVMIVAFLSIDGISHKMDVHPIASLFFGVLGLFLVLAIPAVFVLVLTTVENSDQWVTISRLGFRLPGQLALHWVWRYLHVIGAAMVFGAAFHYLVTAEGHEYRMRTLVRWFLLGLLLQFVTGGLLTMTIQDWIDLWVLIPLGIGIASAVALIWLIYVRSATGEIPHLGYASMVLLPLLLGGMLLTRQFIQQQKVLPLLQKLEANEARYNERLEDLQMQQIAAYEQQLAAVHDDGATIYAQSCSFCHGRTGLGDGEERGNVLVPPERIAYLKADPGYIRAQLRTGVPGTAMPYFTIYEQDRFNRLLDFLGSEFNIFGMPGPIPVRLSQDDQFNGRAYYYRTCVLCHGMDGSGGDYARNLTPPPPNFQTFSPEPLRAMEVITQGYRGTAMPSFEKLPMNLRWGLIQQVYAFRQ